MRTAARDKFSQPRIHIKVYRGSTGTLGWACRALTDRKRSLQSTAARNCTRIGSSDRFARSLRFHRHSTLRARLSRSHGDAIRIDSRTPVS